ncbi:MAG TPA: hypothetical protein VMT82_11515 [candidate division Zixibacteria bacterium]|nr:hypothetical protein [candidate division Zixibacteria bacterium]
MLLDPDIREKFSQRVLTRLHEAFPDAVVGPRGRIADQTADQYSPIDLRCMLPDEQFKDALARLPQVLASVEIVLSLRSEPTHQNSDRRRIFYIRFGGLPLFWRVQLEVVATSVADDPNYDNFNAAARGNDWSLPESALWSAVDAIRSLARGHDKEAHNQLRRAFQRINVPVLPKLTDRELLAKLLEEAPKLEPGQAAFAQEIRQLASNTLAMARNRETENK